MTTHTTDDPINAPHPSGGQAADHCGESLDDSTPQRRRTDGSAGTPRPVGQRPLRVLVVTPDTAMRRGLTIRLDCEEDLVVVGSVHPVEAVDTAIERRAEVAVVGLSSAATERPRVVAALARRLPELGRVLVAVDGSLTRRARGDGDFFVDDDGAGERLIDMVRKAAPFGRQHVRHAPPGRRP